MARNLKKDYLMKLINTNTPNNYSFDLANYIHNPDMDYDYPAFSKVMYEDEETITIRGVYYCKYFDGTGEYIAKTMDYCKAEAVGGWNVAKNVKREVLGAGNRFNLNTLISYC